jgi:nitroreductase
MDVLTAIHGRRSIRRYLPDPVPRHVIEDILWAAVQAPTPPASGETPWSILVIEGVALLDDFGQRATQFARDHTDAKWPHKSGFKVFWDAPTLVLISAQCGNAEALLDCCRAGQNLLLAAHAKGLGSCWLGAPIPWLSSDQVKGEIGIEPAFEPAAAIVLGIPAEMPAGRPRPKPDIGWFKKA